MTPDRQEELADLFLAILGLGVMFAAIVFGPIALLAPFLRLM